MSTARASRPRMLKDDTMPTIDTHRFGESDYLNANDYEVGARVKVKVVDFLGRQDYDAYGGEKDRTGFYKVDDRGAHKEFRFSQTNETLAAKKFGIKSYADLVGKYLTLSVKHYQQGNGFVLEDIRNFESEGVQSKPKGTLQ